MSFSRYTRGLIADILVARATKIGLLTSCETPGAQCAEVSAPIYARQNLKLVVTDDGNVKNSGQTEFPLHPSPWGTIAAYGIFDGSGGLLYQFELPERVPLPSNYGYIIKDGALVIDLGALA